MRNLPAPVVDAGLAIVFVAAVVAERAGDPWPDPATAVAAAVLTIVLAASLAVRRRVPFLGFAIGTAALSAEALLHIPSVFSPLANQIGVYSVGLYATRTRARWALAVIFIGVVLYFVGTEGLAHVNPVETLQVLVVWVATWAIGYTTARRREEQDRTRQAVAGRMVAEERMRMSRELHDLVGHTVNLLVVQAGAARLMLDKNPATTRELLAGMEHTGRETLADLDQVLASLRADSNDSNRQAATAQLPVGLAQLPELVERFTDSGIEVSLTMDPALGLPRNLDVSIYRIVQEALTNTLKHAAPCTATVTVTRDGHSVVVEVCDTGPGMREKSPRGRGLLGIAERVSMCGGVLEQGAGERSGFRLRAALPLP